MSLKSIYPFLIMIWLTILTIWAVNKLYNPAQSVTVHGIPGTPIPQQISTVQMDKDTVWVIDANSNYIRIITHDEDGYHIRGSEMEFQELK
ncbi:hypothetical protein [Cohnella sp. GCM10027633]|uniref:hypothetical protein n=1 Tax=unclassified Cohnella TaxID=2636738 RepID=UPI0036417CB2